MRPLPKGLEYWKRIFRSGNASLEVTGRHHSKKNQSYVLMSNHASLLAGTD